MDAVFFGFKRAHHSVLRLGRPYFKALGLTAARFDMLFAIRAFGVRRMPQRELERVLGVTHPTVSRMLKSLEELGYVRRTVSRRDRRCMVVELTRRGRGRVSLALKLLVRNGMARLALYTALGADERLCAWYDEDKCWEVAVALGKTLLDIRTTFGDSADLDDDYTEAMLGGDV